MGLIDTLADAAKLVQKLDNIELNKTILTLQSQIMDLLAEQQRLKDELRACQEQLNLRQSLVYRDNAYWLPQSGGGEHGPYCTRCWDEFHLTIRRRKLMHNSFFCPKCQDTVDIPSGPGATPAESPPPFGGYA